MYTKYRCTPCECIDLRGYQRRPNQLVSSFILSFFKLFCYIFRNNYRVYSKRLLNTSTVAYATSTDSGAKGEGLVIRPRSVCKICLVKLLYLFRRRVYRPDPTPSSALFAVEINFRIAPSKRGSSKISNQLYGVSEAAGCENDRRNVDIQIQLAI